MTSIADSDTSNISSATTLPAAGLTPLVARPLRTFAAGEQRFDKPDGTADFYGHCADFCVTEGRRSGQSVAEHGLWCTSAMVGHADATREDGTPMSVSMELAQPYIHGTYPTPGLPFVDTMVLLAIWPNRTGGPEPVEVYLSAAELYRLAAAADYMARAADGLDVPMKRPGRTA